MRIIWAIYRSNLQGLYSTAPIVVALMLKEIHHEGLMMLVFFFLSVLFKIRIICFGPFQHVICGIYGLINVKTMLNKAPDSIPV